MPLLEKSSQLVSDEHKNKTEQRPVWCEDCNRYISDKTRHFQSEIHLQNRQNRQQNNIQNTFGNGVEIIMNENTYIKLKVNPTENLEHRINELLSKNYFPRFKYQLSYLSKYSKIINGEEEVFKRWIKSDLIYNHTQQDTHNTLIQKLDDEQLEGSGFVIQEIEEVILEIYKVNDIQASSFIELPPKYKNSQSIINIKNNDQYCFLWCILAYLYPVEDNKNITSSYSKHFDKFNLEGLEFPMKVKDIPKFENLNIGLCINVFELTGTVLTPIHVNKNYLQPQIDLLLYQNHYCLITKLHCLINKDSHMKHVCRRCLTAFSSQPVLIDHIDRCQKQQPTKITFSWKDQLKYEDYHMKVPVPIRVYADFECINQPQKDPKVFFKQIPIAVGQNVISPFESKYYSYFETDCTGGQQSCTKWFVNKMFTLEKIASKYFKTNLELKMSQEEEVQFEQAEEYWLCENPLDDTKVRDHDHLTGKYRGAAHNICNINCKQSSSSFVPIFFHNFSGYDCHLIFEELLRQAFEKGYEPKIFPKSMEKIGCLRFLDSYRFLSSSLDKLVKSLDSLPIMDENGFKDNLFKMKLAYPYEYLNLDNFQEPLNLTKEDYWSTLTQSYPSDDDIKRTQELIDKNKIENGRELTSLYLKTDVLQLADVFENFVKSSLREYKDNPLYSYSLPGYTWKAGLKLTNIKLDFIKDKELLLLLENNIRGGISSVMGDRHVQSDENKQIIYIDANNLYGWAMSQYLPTGEFELLPLNSCNYTDNYNLKQLVEDLLQIPDDNDNGFFIECDLEYPVEIKEKTKNFPFCPYQTKADPNLFSGYMNNVNQPNYKPTSKLMCDVTNKSKYMIHYRMFKFYPNQGMKVTKIHTIYRFKQSPWLGKYIDHNTQKRTKAKTNFEKDLYKLLNNAFFGKTMGNVRDRTNLEFIDHSQIDQRMKSQSKLSFKGIVDHYSKFSVYKLDKKQCLLNQFI